MSHHSAVFTQSDVESSCVRSPVPTLVLDRLVVSKAGLHVRRKHKNKHKDNHEYTPRVNRDDASASTSAKEHVPFSCAYACACVVRVNKPLDMACKETHGSGYGTAFPCTYRDKCTVRCTCCFCADIS